MLLSHYERNKTFFLLEVRNYLRMTVTGPPTSVLSGKFSMRLNCTLESLKAPVTVSKLENQVSLKLEIVLLYPSYFIELRGELKINYIIVLCVYSYTKPMIIQSSTVVYCLLPGQVLFEM